MLDIRQMLGLVMVVASIGTGTFTSSLSMMAPRKMSPYSQWLRIFTRMWELQQRERDLVYMGNTQIGAFGLSSSMRPMNRSAGSSNDCMYGNFLTFWIHT